MSCSLTDIIVQKVMSLDLYCATSQAQYWKIVILRNASAESTNGGEDVLSPSSERDSPLDSDDESQGSDSDINSEDERSNEDGASTSTMDSNMENEEPSNDGYDFEFDFPEDNVSTLDSKVKTKKDSKNSGGNKIGTIIGSQRRFRIRNENKELREEICDSSLQDGIQHVGEIFSQPEVFNYHA